MTTPIENLQRLLGTRFKNQDLLKHALTHRSYTHEHKLPVAESNERLEFLGDAVLGLCMAEMLVRLFQEETEGTLSKRRAALVNQKQLAHLAFQIDLGAALLLGRGEIKTGGRTKPSLLGDAFEAVIGALFIDQGVEIVRQVLEKLFAELIPVSKRIETSQDYKTKLQEYYQKKHKRSPRYILEKETGPDHLKVFDVRIEFAGKILGYGKGHSKREAEQEAARDALTKMEPLELPPLKRKKKHRSSKKKTNEPKEMIAQG